MLSPQESRRKFGSQRRTLRPTTGDCLSDRLVFETYALRQAVRVPLSEVPICKAYVAAGKPLNAPVRKFKRSRILIRDPSLPQPLKSRPAKGKTQDDSDSDYDDRNSPIETVLSTMGKDWRNLPMKPWSGSTLVPRETTKKPKAVEKEMGKTVDAEGKYLGPNLTLYATQDSLWPFDEGDLTPIRTKKQEENFPKERRPPMTAQPGMQRPRVVQPQGGRGDGVNMLRYLTSAGSRRSVTMGTGAATQKQKPEVKEGRKPGTRVGSRRVIRLKKMVLCSHLHDGRTTR